MLPHLQQAAHTVIVVCTVRRFRSSVSIEMLQVGRCDLDSLCIMTSVVLGYSFGHGLECSTYVTVAYDLQRVVKNRPPSKSPSGNSRRSPAPEHSVMHTGMMD